MIYNGIFDVKYNYCGYASAGYWGLQLTTVEVFILTVEKMTTAKDFNWFKPSK